MYELQSDGVDWNLKMQVSDTSVSNVICLVSTDLLDRIFGFTVSQCKKLFDESKIEILRQKKMEAERKLAGFRRLDLIMSIEISPQNDKIPLIIDVKTISDALNVL
ncbi:unnamed protein product [Caenorhabditis angaria]|uniref:Uncharacterized protein n=1 Tax=Caenorhabditis angaria TaxID=860376 RepID=A0A9P1I6C7_9PELO|nr:unnamed protein product [Caenorhabditis angaria]